MENEDSALYVANHLADFANLDWCHVKMFCAHIAAPSNAIVSCGFIYQKGQTSLTAGQKKCCMLRQSNASNLGLRSALATTI